VALPARGRRYLKRALGRNPRILRGPVSMIAVSYNQKADHLYGYASDVVVAELNRVSYPYVFRSEVTRVISESKGAPRLWMIWTFLSILWKYDIWVAFFSGKFFKKSAFDRYEAPLLKLAGIRIVTVPYGSDVTMFNGLQSRFDWLGRLWQDKAFYYQDREAHNAKVKSQIAHFNHWADFTIAGDHSLAPFLPKYDLNFKYFPIDCDAWKPLYETGNAVPLIVHAPNHRHVKGTDVLLQACERLKQQGLKFDLQLVERVPRNQVQEIYRQADIIAEQFIIGVYGLTALEGLALGKPVLTYLSEEHLQNPVFNLPLVNTHPDNIEEVLKALILLPQLRKRLGLAGRESVERYQSCEAVGEVWDQIYRHLWFGEPLRLETTCIFSPQRKSRPLCEDPRQPEFWPVDVKDLLKDICAALDIQSLKGSEVY
jgi:glycosyltransferase involved in cell wall biosynthesis